MFYGHHHHHHRNQLPWPVTLGMFVVFLTLRIGVGSTRVGHVSGVAPVGIGLSGYRPSPLPPDPHGAGAPLVSPAPEAAPPSTPNPVWWALGLGGSIAALGLLGAAFLWTSGADDEPRTVRRRPSRA